MIPKTWKYCADRQKSDRPSPVKPNMDQLHETARGVRSHESFRPHDPRVGRLARSTKSLEASSASRFSSRESPANSSHVTPGRSTVVRLTDTRRRSLMLRVVTRRALSTTVHVASFRFLG